MLRNKAFAALQKAYDDSYLSCSTAVYYEGQGNEDEARRYWRAALSLIEEHQAAKSLTSFVPRSETEKALAESLRQLELQCKERMDLLEALRISRDEGGVGGVGSLVPPHGVGSFGAAGSTGRDSFPVASPSEGSRSGWIGGGTIPAVRYPDLSRPALPPRPTLAPSRSSSDMAVVGRSYSSGADSGGHVTGGDNAAGPASPKEGPGHSPAPEKYTMRHTLRTGKTSDKTSRIRRKQSPRTAEGPGASRAATAAWSALTSRDPRVRRSALETSSPSLPTPQTSEGIRATATSPPFQWDSHSRRLVVPREGEASPEAHAPANRRSEDNARPSLLSVSAASSALGSLNVQDQNVADELPLMRHERGIRPKTTPLSTSFNRRQAPDMLQAAEQASSDRKKSASESQLRRKALPGGPALSATPPKRRTRNEARERQKARRKSQDGLPSDESGGEDGISPSQKLGGQRQKGKAVASASGASSSQDSPEELSPDDDQSSWSQQRQNEILKNVPAGVDMAAAKQILNEIVVHGDEVRWSDVAGLEVAKSALRETVVYPFLRPDLFMGLREPARGMLLFGPPGTGKTMLARAVATESRCTFFSISASSLTSKYLGESEKLVRALFALAKLLAPSIVFVDEIDSLLGQRSGSGDHEATRRIKTEFLIQWSDLQRAAAGRDPTSRDKTRSDANMVLVLAATNLPWAIDEAARRRFVRRQYIPLPEAESRAVHLRTLLGHQKHGLAEADIDRLIALTEGYSGSDITALAKDAAMGPLRSLGEAVLHMSIDNIRPIELADFEASLDTIRPSVSKEGLAEHEEWAKKFGERGG